jgi:hypothetical protein
MVNIVSCGGCGKYVEVAPGYFWCDSDCKTSEHRRLLGKPAQQETRSLAPPRRATTSISDAYLVLADAVAETEAPERRRNAAQQADRLARLRKNVEELTSY